VKREADRTPDKVGAQMTETAQLVSDAKLVPHDDRRLHIPTKSFIICVLVSHGTPLWIVSV
jgi:hypothetical protein